MKLICPECKNAVDLSAYPDLAVGNIVECDHCGITLSVLTVDENCSSEIVDEGK